MIINNKEIGRLCNLHWICICPFKTQKCGQIIQKSVSLYTILLISISFKINGPSKPALHLARATAKIWWNSPTNRLMLAHYLANSVSLITVFPSLRRPSHQLSFDSLVKVLSPYRAYKPRTAFPRPPHKNLKLLYFFKCF